MKNWAWRRVWSVLFLTTTFLTILVMIILKSIVVTPEAIPAVTEFPKIEISLNGIDLADIYENGKDIKYLGNGLSLIFGNEVLGFSGVEIKGRGNATWSQEKKPLQFKLKEKADLMGLGSRNKWILLANYMDHTNLRTDTAFYIERMVGEEFAYAGEFVELYVNGEYEGLYYLTRGVEVGKNAVDLKDPLGILVELDNVYGEMEELCSITDNGERLTVKDAVAEDNIEAAMVDFMVDFNELERSIKTKDYARIKEIIDVESFAEYYLISELIVNTDAYYTSQYFYKDGAEDKIHAGPAWDFDIALNNYRMRDDFPATVELTRNDDAGEYWGIDEQYLQWSRLFARLIEFPEFRGEVDRVFQERLSGRKDQLLQYIAWRATKIYPAALRESERWAKDGYVEDVKRMLNWVNDRYDYFEIQYGAKL